MDALIERLEKATAWRPVDGWPYEVSDTGVVRSLRTNKPVRPSISHNGYEHVMFSVAKKRATFRVHRLVAAAFFGSIPAGMHVNHIDGIKRNNYATNLEVVSGEDNERHAVANKLKASGARNGTKTMPERIARGARASRAKLTDAAVIEIRRLRSEGAKLTELASRFDVDQSLISQICRRKIWTHL